MASDSSTLEQAGIASDGFKIHLQDKYSINQKAKLTANVGE